MPSQISPPIEYNDGDPINGQAFNQHVSHAVLLNGSITEQTDISSSAVPSVNAIDSLVIYDESEVTTNKLRKIKVQDLFNTGTPIEAESVITSEIDAKPLEDLIIKPNLGTLITGKSYYTSNGFDVTVTSTAHELESGMLVEFSASSFGNHNGRFQITVLTVDTFSYNNGKTTAEAVGSGTISYRKAATASVIGNLTVNDDLKVAGNTNIAGNANIGGAVNVGSLKIGGKTPLTQEDSFVGISTKTVVLPTGTGFNSIDYQTQSFNVPVGETWTFVWNIVTHMANNNGNTRPDYAHTWYVKVNSLTGSTVDTILAGNQPYGGTSVTTRTISIRNEGPTGNTHIITSPTVGMTYSGTMNLTWSANTPYSWNKWSQGHITLTLYRQKTSNINTSVL